MARAEAWVARCAERAMVADDARRSNHGMAREVGLPLMRGLLAFARGDDDAAADLLYAARGEAQRFGGSHAQRDLIDQTLLAAAARGSRAGTRPRADQRTAHGQVGHAADRALAGAARPDAARVA